MIGDRITDLSSQSEVVLEQLIEKNKMSRGQAVSTWYKSKTKAEIEKIGAFYVSGMRCYWELMLELKQDSKWMTEPLDF